MPISDKGIAVVRSFEGRALTAYLDSAGVWTIGYGATNYDKFAVQYLGRKIGAGLKITEEQAEYLLRHTLDQNYGPAVEVAMAGAAQCEFDGGTSFHYNTGAIARATWVKLWRTKKDFHASILSWNKAGGKVLRGLTRRREREYQIVTRGDYGPEGETKPPVLNEKGVPVAATESTHALAGTPGMLRLGDTGPDVQDLNESLALVGFKVSGTAFTLDTEEAVKAFQSAHKQLGVDGIAGPATRSALNREADLKRKLSKTTKLTASGQVGAVAADVAAHGGMPVSVYVTIAVVGLIVAGFIAWKYRDELTALAKR